MNKKYYSALSQRLTKKARQIAIYSTGQNRVRLYDDYFYNIGTNQILSDIIIKLSNECKLSKEDLNDLLYRFWLTLVSLDYDEWKKPLFLSPQLGGKKVKWTRDKFIADCDEQLKEMKKEKELGIKCSYDLSNKSVDKKDIEFLKRIHNLIKDELIELEYNTANEGAIKIKAQEEIVQDHLSLNYEYDEANYLGVLMFNKKRISFSGGRAMIINYFFTANGIDNRYKSYHDVNSYFISNYKKITSTKLRLDIVAINIRVKKETKGLIKQIIGLRDKSRDKEINVYKWEIKT